MDPAPLAEQRRKARRRAMDVALLVGGVLAVFMFVPTGSNGYVAADADGSHHPATYYFSFGTLVLRELLGGTNNLHRLGVDSAAVGTVVILMVCSVIYLLMRPRQPRRS